MSFKDVKGMKILHRHCRCFLQSRRHLRILSSHYSEQCRCVIFTEDYLVNGGKVAGTLEEESSAGGQVGTEARVAVTPPACSGTNSWNQALNSLSPVSGSSGTKPWQATKIFENIPNVYLAIQLMHLLCRL